MPSVRCPHCQMALLEEEIHSASCPLCGQTLQAPPEPAAVIPPAPPVPQRRRHLPLQLGLGLSGLLLLLTVLWFATRPPVLHDPAEHATTAQVARAPTAPVPSGSTTPAEEAPPAPSAKASEATRTTAVTNTDEKKTAATTPKEPAPTVPARPEPYDRDDAHEFAKQLLYAAETVAGKYYQPLDEEALLDKGLQGLLHALKATPPEALTRELQPGKGRSYIDKLELLIELRSALGKRADLPARRDVDVAVQSMIRQLEPTVSLLDAAAMARMRSLQFDAKLGELGLLLRRQPRGDAIEIVTPYKDGPAHRAGIEAGDRLTQLREWSDADGTPLAQPRDVALAGLTDEALQRLPWGSLHSKATLTIQRQEKALESTLTRAKVKRENLLGVKRHADASWDHVLDEQHGLYYVRILDFQRADMGRDLRQLLARLDKLQPKGLVLDLRFAGSGLLDTAVDVANLFVAEGLIVEYRWRNQGSGRRMASGKISLGQVPLVCLLNAETGGTCAEMVAACLQDHKRAVIVGERSAGKAGAQNYYPLGQSTLRITTSHAYRPNGKPLDKAVAAAELSDDWGVTPDAGLRLDLPAAERDQLRAHLQRVWIIPSQVRPAFRDRQLEMALEHLRR